MAKPFQLGAGDWTQYRSTFSLTNSDEIDLHFGRREGSTLSYDEAMAEVTDLVENSLREARRKGRSYVMFTHGSSTSRPGQTTARSQVRRFMRSKAATQLIDRSGSIQHESVFVAKLKPGADKLGVVTDPAPASSFPNNDPSDRG
jgi:hypothetical protein